MKSVISSAALCAAALSQLGAAASISHPHSHLHRRTPAFIDKREFADFMEPSDFSSVKAKGIQIGKNLACSDKQASIAVGHDGPFVVEFNNKGDEDIVVTVWSGKGQWGAVAATFVGVEQPDVTHTLKANTSTTVAFRPDLEGGSISGGWAAIYPDTVLTPFSGQINNVWGEYTFQTSDAFSTTDVSRLVNMAGNKMEIHNYASKDDADDDTVDPACSSTMDRCVFVCDNLPAGVNHCLYGRIDNCPAGTPGTTSNGGMDGGCAGMASTGGYVVANFF